MSSAKRGSNTNDVIRHFRADPTSIVTRSEEILQNPDYEYLKHAKHTTHDAFHYRHATQQGKKTGKNWMVRFFANNVWIPKVLTAKSSSDRKLAAIDHDTGAVICLEGEAAVRYAIADKQFLAIHDFELAPGWEKRMHNLSQDFDLYQQAWPRDKLLKFTRQNFAINDRIPAFLEFIKTGKDTGVYDSETWDRLVKCAYWKDEVPRVAEFDLHLRKHPIEKMLELCQDGDSSFCWSQCQEPGCRVALADVHTSALYATCTRDQECSFKMRYFTGDGEYGTEMGRCRHCPSWTMDSYELNSYRRADRPSEDEYDDDENSDVERAKVAKRKIRRAKFAEVKDEIRQIIKEQGIPAAREFAATIRNRQDVILAGAKDYNYPEIVELAEYEDDDAAEASD